LQGLREGIIIFLKRTWGLKAMDMVLVPKMAFTKGTGSGGLILVLPKSMALLVDGNGSLINSRGGDEDGIRFIATVAEAGDGTK
jgi:hypothetical protein